MPPQNPLEPENTELDAIAFNGAETNEKLESLTEIAEANLVQQDRTLEAIRDLEPILENSLVAQDAIREAITATPIASIENGASITIKGVKGDDGYTPVKGVDYYTPEEQEELIATILPSATPILGQDYFTLEERESFASEILSAATPVKGVDYFDGADGRDGKDGRDGESIVGPQGPRGLRGLKGTDGKDGSPDTGDDIVRKIDGLLPYSSLKGAPDLNNFMNRIASRDYDLVELKDVQITNPSNGEVLKYDSTLRKWVNGTGGSSGIVQSVVGSTYIGVDSTTPASPIVSLLTGIPATYIGAGLVDNTEFSYLNGATSNIQDQINTLSAANYWSRSSGNLYPTTLTDKVGIGTNTPNSLLEVSASDTGTTITAASLSMAEITNTSTTNNSFSDWAFSTLDAGGTRAVSSKIVGVHTSHTTGAVSGNLAFLTNNAGTLSEAMRILANNNVGIGTNNPQSRLHVFGAALVQASTATNTLSALTAANLNQPQLSVVNRAATGNYGGLHIYTGGVNSGTFLTSDTITTGRWSVGGAYQGASQYRPTTTAASALEQSSGALIYSYSSGLTQGTPAGLTELFRITNAGSVGILTNNPNSTLQVNGSFASATRTITANRTLDGTDNVIFADTSAGGFTVTLPTAVGITGREYTVIKTSASNTLVFATTSSQTVNGAVPTTYNMTAIGSLTFISNGANWYVK